MGGNDEEVLDGGGAAEIEEIGAESAVSGAGSLAVAQMGEAVLDPDALAELLSAFRRALPLAQRFVEGLLWVHIHRPSPPRLCRYAPLPLRTRRTHGRGKEG